ncbi:MAG: hypothetical protein GX142_02370 [Chloroflexi bacterium]|nr:hypothetical protein [Chloroflexota bacterium]
MSSILLCLLPNGLRLRRRGLSQPSLILINLPLRLFHPPVITDKLSTISTAKNQP